MARATVTTEAQRAYKKARYVAHKANGRCASCSRQPKAGCVRCAECIASGNRSNKRQKAEAISKGLCRNCFTRPQIPHNGAKKIMDGSNRTVTYCDLCYLKLIARYTLGSADKYQILLDKLYRHDWRCVYTGEKLVLGDNLSFDHIKPVSRFPELKFDPTNIEPISLRTNFVKRNLTKQEFLDLIEQVHTHRHAPELQAN